MEIAPKTGALQRHIPLQTPDDLIARIVDSIADLLTRREEFLVKTCDGNDCDWLFIDRTKARQRFEEFDAAFVGLSTTICFAMKANSNQAVLTLLANSGAGADVVSEGELRRALAAGIPAAKIVFSGVGKSRQEVEFALGQKIRCLNVESVSELRMISEIATSMGVTAPLSVRVNPDVDPKTHVKLTTGKSGTKFGISWDRVMDFFEIADGLPGLKLSGIDPESLNTRRNA